MGDGALVEFASAVMPSPAPSKSKGSFGSTPVAQKRNRHQPGDSYQPGIRSRLAIMCPVHPTTCRTKSGTPNYFHPTRHCLGQKRQPRGRKESDD